MTEEERLAIKDQVVQAQQVNMNLGSQMDAMQQQAQAAAAARYEREQAISRMAQARATSLEAAIRCRVGCETTGDIIEAAQKYFDWLVRLPSIMTESSAIGFGK
jgi:hypothetical protein